MPDWLAFMYINKHGRLLNAITQAWAPECARGLFRTYSSLGSVYN